MNHEPDGIGGCELRTGWNRRNGSKQKGVQEGEGYTLSGVTTAIDAGSYTAYATPTAKSGLVYNGKAQVGVAVGKGYELKGVTSATDAGSYTAYATLDSNRVWSDGTAAS